MFSTTQKFFFLIGAILVLLSSACEICDDPGVIEIDPADRTFPELYWEITTRSFTPGGVASSVRLVSGDNETITMSSTEEVDVKLVAVDNESGIEWMDLQGGFGITCGNPNGAIAFSGIIPGNQIFFDLGEMECGQAEGEYPTFTINAASLCTAEFPNLTQGGYQFNGSSNNTVGLTRGIILTVDILPAVTP